MPAQHEWQQANAMLSRGITCSYSIFCLPCWDPSRSTANPGFLLLSQFSTVSSDHSFLRTI